MGQFAKQKVNWEALPSVLYKYQQFGGKNYGYDLIERPELYFAAPSSFNDLFDGAIPYELKTRRSDFENFLNQALKEVRPDLNSRGRKEKISQRLKEAKAGGEKEWFHEMVVQKRDSNFGVCSLTPDPKNLLMWPHYAGNHKGYCIGFKTSSLRGIREICERLISKQGIRVAVDVYKVDYEEKMPSYDFYDLMLANNSSTHIVEMLCVKSIDWEYEEEYRLILFGYSGVKVPLPDDAVDRVILGARIEPKNEKELMEKIKKSPSDITVYKARRDIEAFDLSLEKIA